MTPALLLPTRPLVDPIEDATRREFITGVGAAALAAAFLAACGGDDGEEATPSTRTIETARGPVDVPVTPSKVVAVVNYAMNALFSLGVTPAGVPDGFADAVLPAERAMYDAAPKVGQWDAIDVEQVAALQPDLILGLDIELNAPIYDQLSQVAPTVFFSLEGTSDWEKVTEEFAGAMGIASELTDLVDRYRARAAEVKAAHETKLAETKFVMANAFETGWVIWYPDASGAQVLSEAGVQWASAAAGKTGNYAEYSLEEVNLLEDADVILIRANGGVFNEGSQAFLATPTVQSLPAVAAGHALPVANLFPMSYTQALALLDELDAILSQI